MKDGLYTRHEVACIIADLFADTCAFDDTCACDFSAIDEWLTECCELDKCPGDGVACWEQYLMHKDKREERDD